MLLDGASIAHCAEFQGCSGVQLQVFPSIYHPAGTFQLYWAAAAAWCAHSASVLFLQQCFTSLLRRPPEYGSTSPIGAWWRRRAQLPILYADYAL